MFIYWRLSGLSQESITSLNKLIYLSIYSFNCVFTHFQYNLFVFYFCVCCLFLPLVKKIITADSPVCVHPRACSTSTSLMREAHVLIYTVNPLYLKIEELPVDLVISIMLQCSSFKPLWSHRDKREFQLFILSRRTVPSLKYPSVFWDKISPVDTWSDCIRYRAWWIHPCRIQILDRKSRKMTFICADLKS